MELIGRGAERRIIKEALTSASPELVAVWGRRRVGKTFLIRQGRAPIEDHFFEVTGRRNARRKEQLGHFMDGFMKAFRPSYTLPLPQNWDGALRYLSDAIESFPNDDKPITCKISSVRAQAISSIEDHPISSVRYPLIS